MRRDYRVPMNAKLWLVFILLCLVFSIGVALYFGRGDTVIEHESCGTIEYRSSDFVPIGGN